MQPPSMPPPMQPVVYQTPGPVVAFRIFTGFYAACAFFLALFSLARATGWDLKLGLRPEGAAAHSAEDNWAMVLVFVGLGIAMLGCTFISATPQNWGVGLAALIVGLTCCGVPALVLIILWCQTPTRQYFASHGWKTFPPPMPPPPVPPMH